MNLKTNLSDLTAQTMETIGYTEIEIFIRTDQQLFCFDYIIQWQIILMHHQHISLYFICVIL